MSSPLKKTLFVIGLALWFAAVARGMKWMSDYSLTPGEAGVPAAAWPDAEIRRGEGRHTLVVGLHPECPCSRATLAELDRVLVEAGDALEAVVVLTTLRPRRRRGIPHFIAKRCCCPARA